MLVGAPIRAGGHVNRLKTVVLGMVSGPAATGVSVSEAGTTLHGGTLCSLMVCLYTIIVVAWLI